ncbi:hypothetical protein ACOMHN_014566 [Nucella lapillus]
MVLTETWLKESGDESKIADLTPPGYKLFSFPRQLSASIKGGGGIAVIMKDCLASHTSINTTLSFTHTSFEAGTAYGLVVTIWRRHVCSGGMMDLFYLTTALCGTSRTKSLITTVQAVTACL